MMRVDADSTVDDAADNDAAPAAAADALALTCAQTMLRDDACSAALNLRLEGAGAGWAALSMQVTARMLNGHDVCHGGMIFTLADTAFACACNGYNRVTLAAGASIEYLRPARLGDALTARGRERKRGQATGVYDIEVRNQDAQLVALFRGQSFATQRAIIDAPDNSTVNR